MTNKEIMKKIELNQRTLNLWTSELENFHGFVETRIFLETAIPKKEKEIKRLKSYLQQDFFFVTSVNVYTDLDPIFCSQIVNN